jgi:hypothetical protein
MSLINEVDKPGSEIENYVSSLDKILADKVNKINSLRSRLQKFNILLKDEEALSSKFNTYENSEVLDTPKNDYNLEDELEEEVRGLNVMPRK